MKRLALLAALVILPACTAFHPERRTVTEWNWKLMRDTTGGKDWLGGPNAKAPCDLQDVDGVGNPIINWIIAIPELALLPVSVAVDTVILNPIDGFKKAELQTYNRHYGADDTRGTAESQTREIIDAPMWPFEFVAHWAWNSIYWTDPVNKDDWNKYWNDHNERSTQ